ncbi:MAG: RNA methyltransferase [Bacteroidales bacterium]|nr:RNA methyltransferase [Bacteroidales bacterium]
MKKISSEQNELVKNIIRLNKAAERKGQKLFIIEGRKEISLAVKAGFTINHLLFYPELISQNNIDEFTGNTKEIIEINKAVFSKLAYMDNRDGLIAVAEMKDKNINSLILPTNPFVLVLEAIEKPGNLGAILRTADAAKVAAVIVCDNKTDIFNPNVIRSSRGTVFTVQLAVSNSKTVYSWLKNNKIKIYSASLKADKNYYDNDFRQSSSIILGTEAEGLSEFWHKNSDVLIKIPMQGVADSLNVSVSAAIISFEAIRQRIK